MGPYKRTQITALWQAKFYLKLQALAAAGHLPQRRSRRDTSTAASRLLRRRSR